MGAPTNGQKRERMTGKIKMRKYRRTLTLGIIYLTRKYMVLGKGSDSILLNYICLDRKYLDFDAMYKQSQKLTIPSRVTTTASPGATSRTRRYPKD